MMFAITMGLLSSIEQFTDALITAWSYSYIYYILRIFNISSQFFLTVFFSFFFNIWTIIEFIKALCCKELDLGKIANLRLCWSVLNLFKYLWLFFDGIEKYWIVLNKINMTWCSVELHSTVKRIWWHILAFPKTQITY